MVLSSAALIASGVACIVGSTYTLRAVRPKEGRTDTFLTRTEARSTMLALFLVSAFFIGGGLVLKGIIS